MTSPSSGGAHIELAAARAHVGSIRIACTRGRFTDGALSRLDSQREASAIVCTNTVPIPKDKWTPKLRVRSIAPALAESVGRIHNGESVSALFH
jgi:ribose-phosphate pyrophosphokinase